VVRLAAAELDYSQVLVDDSLVLVDRALVLRNRPKARPHLSPNELVVPGQLHFLLPQGRRTSATATATAATSAAGPCPCETSSFRASAELQPRLLAPPVPPLLRCCCCCCCR
jgi:hypothetical protein